MFLFKKRSRRGRRLRRRILCRASLLLLLASLCADPAALRAGASGLLPGPDAAASGAAPLLISFSPVLQTSLPSTTAASPPSVSALSAVLMDADTGALLFCKNERQRLAMASTTKIMTALLALESPDPQASFAVDSASLRVEGTSMGLLPGDRVTLTDLAVGMLLLSGNDAANAAAVRLAGSPAAFAAKMNARAAVLGLSDTHFVTPSGLDDREHFSTAYDMARLGAAALQNRVFAEICASSRLSITCGTPAVTRSFQNHNRLLRELDGCIGIKTGFTKKAGRCLVSACSRQGRRLICVTLKAPDDWRDHTALYDYGFSLYTPASLPAQKYRLPIVGGTLSSVSALPPPAPPLSLRAGEQLTLTARLRPFEYAPVMAGEVVGCLECRVGECLLQSLPLIAEASSPCPALPNKEKPLNWTKRLFARLRAAFS